jgi:DTW domain-containing protein YfiP
VDVLTEISGVSFDEAFATRLVRDVDGRQIPFIGRETLIRNKRASARPKDCSTRTRSTGFPRERSRLEVHRGPMRSRTLSHLPGRCPRCWIRHEFCLCAEIPQIPTRTRVVIVRHAREADKSTGTARIAGLALPNSAMIDFGEESALVDEEVKPFAEGAWLLFPAEEGTAPLPPTPPSCLIVIDGTWRQTRRMLKKLPSLVGVPRMPLPPKGEAPLRLRESTSADNRSTLEAIADGLTLLEGESVGAPLHRLHNLMVERVFRARGVWELKASGQ